MGVGASGRKVVGQLDKCQSAVETLPLLLEASLGGTSSLVPLVLLLFVGLEELHGVLLLLVLRSPLALRLHLGGSGRALLPGLPVPVDRRRHLAILLAEKTSNTAGGREIGFSLRQPLCHSLVVHRLGLPLALLWFLPLQTGEGVFGTVAVGVCEPIPACCGEPPHQEKSEK